MKPASERKPAPQCRRCPRLASHRRQTAKAWPEHFAAPVTAWGDLQSRLLVVGLAPGLHGAHRTGIPFWGDASGNLLMGALAAAGFMTPNNTSGMAIRISNAVKCLPPGNLPSSQEVERCRPFLLAELRSLASPQGTILTLGGVAHRAVLAALKLIQASYPFGHGSRFTLPDGRTLVSSYHPSRLNTNTGRLTPEAFYQLIETLR